MFFATVALPFLRTIACFALLDQVLAPSVGHLIVVVCIIIYYF
jgi:hypothetical protein